MFKQKKTVWMDLQTYQNINIQQPCAGVAPIKSMLDLDFVLMCIAGLSKQMNSFHIRNLE